MTEVSGHLLKVLLVQLQRRVVVAEGARVFHDVIVGGLFESVDFD